MSKKLSRAEKRKFQNAQVIVKEENTKLQDFYFELNEFTSLKRISKIPLRIEYCNKEDKDALRFSFERNGKYTRTICDYIKLYDKDWYNVTFIPCKNGVEIERFETYQTGKGTGSYLMNIFNEISLRLNTPIYLRPGIPGYGDTKRNDTDPKRQRAFYHRHGFKRMSGSDYWKNSEVDEISRVDICLNKEIAFAKEPVEECDNGQTSDKLKYLTGAETNAMAKWIAELAGVKINQSNVSTNDQELTKMLEKINRRRNENKIDPLLNIAIDKAFNQGYVFLENCLRNILSNS